MNKIGFQNFRRFRNFLPIEYNAITFLVGRNNSGKSTLVKALLLVDDFLKSDNIKEFSFTQNNIEDVNIVTYDRAKNRFALKDDYIKFELETDNINIQLIVSGQEEKTTVSVNLYEISDLSSGFSFIIDPANSYITFKSRTMDNNLSIDNNADLLRQLKENQKKIKSQIISIKEKSSQDFIILNEELNLLKNKIKDINSLIKKNKITDGDFSLSSHFTKASLKDVLAELLFEHSSEYDIQYHEIQRGKKPKKEFENLRAFKDNKFKIEKSIEEIVSRTTNISIAYLGATINKQSALFAIRDKDNTLAQVIHEFQQLGIAKGEKAYRFVLKWMQSTEFEIGEDFQIIMHAGEAYEFLVRSNGVEIPLADKGMGSIQAMLLILRLATIIYKKEKDNKKYIIVIEEPEINLHPALQSKLANLFHDVYTNHGIQLIVETHSEYLIRNTQVIVKNNEYEVEPNDNPFCVIYFDKDMEQWHMNYRKDGKFTDDFGKGFYDESALLTLDLF